MKSSDKKTSGISKFKRYVPCINCLKKKLSLCKVNNANKDLNKIIFTVDSDSLDIPHEEKCDEGCSNLHKDKV